MAELVLVFILLIILCCMIWQNWRVSPPGPVSILGGGAPESFGTSPRNRLKKHGLSVQFAETRNERHIDASGQIRDIIAPT